MILKLISLFLYVFTVTAQGNDTKFTCTETLDYMFTHLTEPWALQMIDSFTKLPSGLLTGNIIHLGNFDECVDINYTNEMLDVQGQYCIAKITGFPLGPMSKQTRIKKNNLTPENRLLVNPSGTPGFSFAICAPASCSENEMKLWFNTQLENINELLKKILLLDVTLAIDSFLPFTCQTKKTFSEYYPEDIAVITFLVFILLLMILSTIYDIYLHHFNKEPAHIILIAFSVLSNGKKLIATSNNPKQLPCLNGIRSISMMWVILGHIFTYQAFKPLLNLTFVIEWLQDASTMYLQGASVSVDTFFLLSGLLVVYSYMLATDKGSKFNIFIFYFHRYLRLTPLLAVIILIHLTIFKYFGSGPNWQYAHEGNKMACTDYWWTTLLYVQNYVNVNEMCVGQSWYLSADMHLFILSPVVLVSLKRHPKKALILLFNLIIASIIVPFVVTWDYEIEGSALTGGQAFNEHYYFKTHNRFGPYVIGMVLGYYLYLRKSNKTRRIHLNSITILVAWTLSVGLMLTIVYAPYNITQHLYEKVESSIFLSMHRQAWAIAICWVIFACTEGYGGIVNWFLSLPLFQILARFSYSMYLTHISIMIIQLFKTRTTDYFNEMKTLSDFWGTFMFTLAVSVVMTLAFESPVIIIEKILFSTGNRKNETKREVAENHERQHSQPEV